MEKKIEDIKQVALRSRVIIVGSGVICTLLTISVLLWLLQRPQQIPVIYSKSYGTSTETLQRQTDAVNRLSQEQIKTSLFFAKRDSMLQVELHLNRKAIEKIKIPHEKYRHFNYYTASEWTAYFADLPERQ